MVARAAADRARQRGRGREIGQGVDLAHGYLGEHIRVEAFAPQADTRMTWEFGAMVMKKENYKEGRATDPGNPAGYTAAGTEFGDFG